jgi:hypothetical protein
VRYHENTDANSMRLIEVDEFTPYFVKQLCN